MSIFRGIERVSLPDEGPSPEYVLMKSFESLECDPAREERMTAALRECYRKFVEVLQKDRTKGDGMMKFDFMEHVYAAMQNLDKSKSCPRDEERERAILKRCYRNSRADASDFYDNYYWSQVDFEPEERHGYSFMAILKLYICVPDCREVGNMFYEALERLLDLGEYFFAKMSMFERKDSICIWCGQNGFKVLAKLVAENKDKFADGALPFVPFYQGIGVSREFRFSFNAAIANLLCLYFLGDVCDESEISCEGFLRRAVSAYFTDFGPALGTRDPDELPLEHYGFKNSEMLEAFPVTLGYLLKEHRNLERFEYLTLIDSFNVKLGGWNEAETSLLRPKEDFPWLESNTQDRAHCW